MEKNTYDQSIDLIFIAVNKRKIPRNPTPGRTHNRKEEKEQKHIALRQRGILEKNCQDNRNGQFMNNYGIQ